MTTLALKHVNKIFGSGLSQVTALQDINFTSEKGTLTLILGPSGSGKSTLLTILGGLQSSTNGEVLINDVNVNHLSAKQQEHLRLNQIGFILQAYNLVPYLKVQEQFELVDTVKNDNLSEKSFSTIIDKLGIQNLLQKYPSELSGGQTQRIALARALYPNPDIVLADEPTAALDSERVITVGQLLQDMAHMQNKAVVTVTHDTRLERFADYIYELVDGQLTQTK